MLLIQRRFIHMNKEKVKLHEGVHRFAADILADKDRIFAGHLGMIVYTGE